MNINNSPDRNPPTKRVIDVRPNLPMDIDGMQCCINLYLEKEDKTKPCVNIDKVFGDEEKDEDGDLPFHTMPEKRRLQKCPIDKFSQALAPQLVRSENVHIYNRISRVVEMFKFSVEEFASTWNTTPNDDVNWTCWNKPLSRNFKELMCGIRSLSVPVRYLNNMALEKYVFGVTHVGTVQFLKFFIETAGQNIKYSTGVLTNRLTEKYCFLLYLEEVDGAVSGKSYTFGAEDWLRHNVPLTGYETRQIRPSHEGNM